jgi:hypothetical protein
MKTSCKPAITWSWPTKPSSNDLTVESALTCPTVELPGYWKRQADSMISEGSPKKYISYLERNSWALQQIARNLYLKDWPPSGPVWTEHISQAMRWLDPSIPAQAIQNNPDLFGDPEAFRLVFMTFPRTSQ